ncbi:uncharacterized protein BO97DRAFT_419683 [Aspergillus homomorphus CBS 101889]|uniref:Uncharacterized protein n=1 Tax=Aspergillus homomorphus (strain CBS 101889) TaxID=1450537 RepID=A0A395IBS4_ASPHC|nr:hypothetical protein BO97DRAFT_419683 [Aspergillus homomorphus CBS 101889]RAL17445.1 hypothetical protein BO97DRAFT_419683 [Aspergillus homomorphus CBS 101889]
MPQSSPYKGNEAVRFERATVSPGQFGYLKYGVGHEDRERIITLTLGRGQLRSWDFVGRLLVHTWRVQRQENPALVGKRLGAIVHYINIPANITQTRMFLEEYDSGPRPFLYHGVQNFHYDHHDYSHIIRQFLRSFPITPRLDSLDVYEIADKDDADTGDDDNASGDEEGAARRREDARDAEQQDTGGDEGVTPRRENVRSTERQQSAGDHYDRIIDLIHSVVTEEDAERLASQRETGDGEEESQRRVRAVTMVKLWYD